VWHHSLLLMNSFNKTEAAVFSCRLCFLRAFPFISLLSPSHHSEKANKHHCRYLHDLLIFMSVGKCFYENRKIID